MSEVTSINCDMENKTCSSNKNNIVEDMSEDVEIIEHQPNHPTNENNVGAADIEDADIKFLLIEKLGRDLSMNCFVRCPRFEYGTIASLNTSFQNVVKNGELDKLRRSLGIIENVIFFSCDPMKWHAILPDHRQWLKIPSATCDGCFMFSDKESLAVGFELLVFGRAITSNMMLKYNIFENRWKEGNPPNVQRCLFGSASHKEICILAGGCDPKGNTLNSAEMYNSITSHWTMIGNMNVPRQKSSGFFMDDKFYVIGGVDENSGEFYDFSTKTWTLVPNMYPQAEFNARNVMSSPPLAAVVKNELYIADHVHLMLKKYIKTNNSWVTIGRLPVSVASMNGWGLAFRGCGDRLIVIGGARNLNGGFLKIYAWIPNERELIWNLIGMKQLHSFVYNCAVMQC